MTVAPIPDRLHLPLRFDAGAMRRDLDRFGDDGWVEHFVKQNYDGDWSVLPLRAPEGAVHPIKMIYSDPAAERYVDTPLLDAMPAMRAAFAALDCPLQATRLMRLGPGSVIKPHRDHDLSFEQGMVRLHIPVATNPGVDFRLNGERVTMEAGSCWYLRLSDPHSVANRGPDARIHLVVDAAVNDWLAELIGTALGGPPPRGAAIMPAPGPGA